MVCYNRSLISYLLPLSLGLLSLYNLFRTEGFVSSLFYSIATTLLFSAFIWAVVYSKALKIENGSVTYYKNYFRHYAFRLQDIERFEQSKNSFSEYKIYFKDGSSPISISSLYISIPNVEELRQSLN